MPPEISVICQPGLVQPASAKVRNKADIRMGRVLITLGEAARDAYYRAPMYIPDHFREDRPEVLHDAVRRIGFATLVTTELDANHLPMLLQESESGWVLRGHVARANPVWKKAKGEALAIFLGPHAYVSPNWYPSKTETG